METLKESFKKNRLFYKLLDRNDSYALYELTFKDKIGSEVVGYEVDRIRINKAGDRFGKHFQESESLPSNEQFGTDGTKLERSKAFFPHELDRAKEYLNLPEPKRLEALSVESGINPLPEGQNAPMYAPV